jgi:hypothetical protein
MEYGDKASELLRPEDLTLRKVMPRYSMLEHYEGKERLEPGVSVRLRWDSQHDRCEAVVLSVSSDYAVVNAMYENRLEALTAEQKVRFSTFFVRNTQILTASGHTE